VQCVPRSTDLWLAWAKLENYEKARAVLNRARDANPTDYTIYVAAAKLEEAQANIDLVQKIIHKAIRNLQKHQVSMNRDQWLTEAVLAEQADSLATTRAIIKETMNFGLEIDSFATDKEREKLTKGIWLSNAAAFIDRGAIECARALLRNAVGLMPHKKSLWRKAIELESECGSKQSLRDLLVRAVEGEQSRHEFLFIELANVLFASEHAE